MNKSQETWRSYKNSSVIKQNGSVRKRLMEIVLGQECKVKNRRELRTAQRWRRLLLSVTVISSEIPILDDGTSHQVYAPSNVKMKKETTMDGMK